MEERRNGKERNGRQSSTETEKDKKEEGAEAGWEGLASGFQGDGRLSK